RLLPDRAQARASPSVRGHPVGHRRGGAIDAGARRADRPRGRDASRMVRRGRRADARLAARRAGRTFRPLQARRRCRFNSRLSGGDVPGRQVNQVNSLDHVASGDAHKAGLARLALLGGATTALTLATPFAFWSGGDNAYMACAVATGLIAVMATRAAEQARSARALWLVIAVAVLLRGVLLMLDPL